MRRGSNTASTRNAFEEAGIRVLLGAGYLFFVAIVFIPFDVMVMTSLKSRGRGDWAIRTEIVLPYHYLRHAVIPS